MLSYAPAVSKAKTLRIYRMGEYDLLLLGRIRARGSVRYLYILYVFQRSNEELCLCVASEENGLAKKLGQGSHFLGVLPGEGHENLGASDDWADVEKFAQRSLEIARERLNVQATPELVSTPSPWWRFW